jgi:hypothetical protein
MDKAYVTLVRRLAETHDSEIISNSSIEHASVLIGEMFQRGSGEAQIFTGSLNPALYAREEIVSAIGSYLSNSTSHLRILIQDVAEGVPNADIFIEKVKERLGESVLPRIEVKIADNFAKDQPYHFTTVGTAAFRFEPDRNKHEAFASFGRPETVEKINTIFQSFWDDAISCKNTDLTAMQSA